MSWIDHQPDGSIRDYKLLRHGKSLPSQEARALKRKVALEPNDVRSRLFLLGYLENNRPNSAAYANNLIWFIDNRPNDIIHEFVRSRDTLLFRKAKKRWLRQVRLNPNNTRILYNAARFCQGWCLNDSVKFLKRASQLSPESEDYALELAQVYSRMAGKYSPRKNRALARKSVEQIKIAIDCYAIRNHEHSYLLQYFDFEVLRFAEVALAQGLLDEANELGQILLKRKALDKQRIPPKVLKQYAPQYHRSSNFGNSILGRVALVRGDAKTAKRYLSRMILVSADWFADWKLAQQLLQAGEAELVAEYVEHCRRFWQQIVNDLQKGLPNRTGYLPATLEQAVDWEKKTSSWINQIKRGRHPQFDRCDC
jgi:hypothetical protein